MAGADRFRAQEKLKKFLFSEGVYISLSPDGNLRVSLGGKKNTVNIFDMKDVRTIDDAIWELIAPTLDFEKYVELLEKHNYEHAF